MAAIATAAALAGAAATAGVGAAVWPEKDTSPRMFTPRDGELALDGKEYRSGLILFRPLGMRCGIRAITGTHLDFYPKGQFCRIRLAATMTGATFARIDSRLHRLVLADGAKVEIDWQSTQIKRQPTAAEVAALGTAVYDLWFDIPKDARAVRLELRAEPTQPEATITLPRHEWPRGLT